MTGDVKLFRTFTLVESMAAGVWNVFPQGYTKPVCQVEILPSKKHGNDPYDFGNVHKAYRVTASNFPRVGELEQVVRGEDLEDYLKSVAFSLHGHH